MVRPSRVAAVLIAVGAGAWAFGLACGDPYVGVEGPDAAPVIQTTLAEAGTDPCERRLPPPAPEVDDAPEVELPTFAMALTESLYQKTSLVGFDLDGVCTCDDRPGAARGGAPSCKRAAGTACDFDGGIDNSAIASGAGFAGFGGISVLPRNQIEGGRSNLLVRVAGYNGKANDKRVAVAVLASDGIFEPRCAASLRDPGSGLWSPGWCGDDTWSVLPKSVIGSDQVPTVAGVGYVRDHVLVVRVTGFATLPFSETSRFDVPDPLLVARLEPVKDEELGARAADAGPPELGRSARLWALQDGVLAARVPTKDFLATLGTVRLRDADGGLSGLCTQEGFPSLVTAVCNAADIASSPPADFGPDTACDALSTAIPFEAKPALVGAVRTRTRAVTGCEPSTHVYACP